MNARILVATSGCVGAGLDCPHVRMVYRRGFPTSILELIQEMGRCGRGKVIFDKKQDKFILSINLNDLVYLFERIYLNDDRKEGVIGIEEQERLEKERLLEVVSFVTLNNGCWHTFLENYSIEPVIP